MPQLLGFIAEPWAMAIEVAVLCYFSVPGNLPFKIGDEYAVYVHPALAGGVYYFYNQMIQTMNGMK